MSVSPGASGWKSTVHSLTAIAPVDANELSLRIDGQLTRIPVRDGGLALASVWQSGTAREPVFEIRGWR